MWAVRAVFGGAAIPLLWLAVAGIIYGVSMPDWRGAARRVAGDRIDRVFDRAAPTEKRFRERWSRIPSTVRDKAREWAISQLGNFQHITDSARLILHGGVLALVAVRAGLSGVGVAGPWQARSTTQRWTVGYLFRVVARVFGPHPHVVLERRSPASIATISRT